MNNLPTQTSPTTYNQQPSAHEQQLSTHEQCPTPMSDDHCPQVKKPPSPDLTMPRKRPPTCAQWLVHMADNDPAPMDNEGPAAPLPPLHQS